MQTQRKNRNKTWRLWAIMLAVLVVVGLVWWVWGSIGSAGTVSNAPQSSGVTQTNEGGQVTMNVSWQGPTAGPVFAVAMDTHAVDLDGYDLRQLAVLRTDEGQEVRPIGWDAPMGGHHRNGMLTFPKMDANGKPVIGPNTHHITLIIRNVAGVSERTFQWTL